ncbi:MAG: septation protein IspZ [Caulobacteraceae bacterium]|nr:septation protein IspZ [Caulobacter sp.]
MTEASRPPPAPWVRGVIDYLGPVAFIVGFFLTHRNLAAAAWWLVGGSAAALVFSLATTRRIAPLPLIWGGFALVFGGLTAVLHDTVFLKIKTTIIDGLLGLFLLGSLLFGRGAPGGALRLLLGEAVHLSDRGWRALTWRYGLFFLVMAGLNEVIWRTQSDTVWALFRMPGLLILAALFAATQLPMMMREARAADAGASVAALTEVQE